MALEILSPRLRRLARQVASGVTTGIDRSLTNTFNIRTKNEQTN